MDVELRKMEYGQKKIRKEFYNGLKKNCCVNIKIEEKVSREDFEIVGTYVHDPKTESLWHQWIIHGHYEGSPKHLVIYRTEKGSLDVPHPRPSQTKLIKILKPGTKIKGVLPKYRKMLKKEVVDGSALEEFIARDYIRVQVKWGCIYERDENGNMRKVTDAEKHLTEHLKRIHDEV